MALALFLGLVMALDTSNPFTFFNTHFPAMLMRRSTILCLFASGLVLSSSKPALNQTTEGQLYAQTPFLNQSDVTGPNPTEVVPFQNQSDTSGPNPLETFDSGGTITPGAAPQTVDFQAFETSFLGATDINVAITEIEELNAVEYQNALGVALYGQTPTISDVSNSLTKICQNTGERAAVIYAIPLEKELQLIGVFPSCPRKQSALPVTSWLTAALDFPKMLFAQNLSQGVSPAKLETSMRTSVPDSNRKDLESTIKTFRRKVSDPRQLSSQSYLPTAQKLYQWLVKPLKPELDRNDIDTLVFTMGPALRSLPVAALHDGQKFLIESYSVAQIPSFGLTDTRLHDIRTGKVLAMGASKFENLNPLPGVPAELQTVITSPNLKGNEYLNQDFTLQRFKELNQADRFSIVHLATHGEFRPGNLSRSFIQLWDQKLSIPQLQAFAKSVGWNDPKAVPIDLLVLSACKTAIGDANAELGFAGLALATGVKSTLASLWSVSDLGTLALMSEFYESIGQGSGKAKALRKAQLQLLHGKIRIQNGKLITAEGNQIALPPELAQQTDLDFSHPYFWSSFMLFGNWH